MTRRPVQALRPAAYRRLVLLHILLDALGLFGSIVAAVAALGWAAGQW